MANETKPEPGKAGSGARVGDAGHPEHGQETGGSDRQGARENNASDDPKRGPSETRPPGRRR